MKKALSIMLLILMMASYTFGETKPESTELTIELNNVVMDLEEPPVIINGRTMLPVRYIFEPLGLTVSWDEVTRTAIGEKEGLRIDMGIDEAVAYVNGEPITLDVPSTIINQRTYVPVRFVAESTGAVVTWDEATFTVGIAYDLDVTQILKNIYDDINDEDGPNYDEIYSDYNQVLDYGTYVRNEYFSSEVQIKKDFVQLAKTCGLNLDVELSIDEMMEAFHNYRQNQHQDLIKELKQMYAGHTYENGDVYYGAFNNYKLDGLGYYESVNDYAMLGQFEKNERHGYSATIFNDSYVYGLYNDNKESGLSFTYKMLENEYYFTLTYFDDGIKKGINKIIFYDLEGNKLNERYRQYNNNESTRLEMVNFESGNQVFFDPIAPKKTLIQVAVDNKIFIAPTDEQGISLNQFTGFGYSQITDDLAYVGSFQSLSRLGDGKYYNADDSMSENLMDQLVAEIIEEYITDQMSDTVKVKTIHDYLAYHVLYDPEPIEEETFKKASHTAYGALVDGVAVCDGYAEAFKYILDQLDIENVLIFGEANQEGEFSGEVNHAWNLVKLNDEYKHYDVTWDDDNTNQLVLYRYFEKSSEEIMETHQWDSKIYEEYLN